MSMKLFSDFMTIVALTSLTSMNLNIWRKKTFLPLTIFVFIIRSRLRNFKWNFNLIANPLKLLKCSIYVELTIILINQCKWGLANWFVKNRSRQWWIRCLICVIKRSLPQTWVDSLEWRHVLQRIIELIDAMILWNDWISWIWIVRSRWFFLE